MINVSAHCGTHWYVLECMAGRDRIIWHLKRDWLLYVMNRKWVCGRVRMCTYRHRLLLLLKPVGAREVCARGSRKPTRSTEHFPSRADIASDSNCNYKHFIINCYPYRRGFRNKRPALWRVSGQHLVSKRKHFMSGLIARANLLLTTASATLIKLVCIHVRIVTRGILLSMALQIQGTTVVLTPSGGLVKYMWHSTQKASIHAQRYCEAFSREIRYVSVDTYKYIHYFLCIWLACTAIWVIGLCMLNTWYASWYRTCRATHVCTAGGSSRARAWLGPL